MKYLFFATLLYLSFAVCGQKNLTNNKQYTDFSPGYDVAVYYFPNYHMTDFRQQQRYGKAWSEWELVKNAKPRFPQHEQPKVPIWGYTDESNSEVMDMKIDVAWKNGIDVFIYDWYWYQDSLFLGKGLEDGFMKAQNNNKLKFSLMWANHNWVDLFPCNPLIGRTPLFYKGEVTPEEFDKMTDYIIEKYFKHPSYWKIDGCPYFSIYELYRFIEGMGSKEKALAALENFRAKTKKAGFKDLHLNAVVWGVQILPGEKELKKPSELIDYLHFNSTTSYVWIHHVSLNKFPSTEYNWVQEEYFKKVDEFSSTYHVPYFPNVTMGWDASPRCSEKIDYKNYGYPCMPIMVNNTPAAFQKALLQSKQWVDKNLIGNKIITINSWNEWTEGSYLEPGRKYGYQYLEAIKEVFK